MVAAQCDTWFQVPGSVKLSHSRRGTQPGCQLADLLFNLSMKPILTQVHSDIQNSMYSRNIPDAHDGVFVHEC
eukprot:4554066-Karenia_brevis.AAC.1